MTGAQLRKTPVATGDVGYAGRGGAGALLERSRVGTGRQGFPRRRRKVPEFRWPAGCAGVGRCGVSQHDGDFEEFMLHALHAAADSVEPSPNGLERIRARLAAPDPAPAAWLMSAYEAAKSVISSWAARSS